jgi:hypothetical protein
MTHPIVHLATTQPQLLAEHAAAYAGLLSEALRVQADQLKRRWLLQAAGCALLLVAGLLAGVAVLLWATWPSGSIRYPAYYIWVPALPALLGMGLLVFASKLKRSASFINLRLQLREDAELLGLQSVT